MLIPILGLISFTFYGYRHGYSSIYDAMDRRRKMMETIEKEKDKVAVEFKLIGIIVSTYIIFYGFSNVQF